MSIPSFIAYKISNNASTHASISVLGLVQINQQESFK
jgi:hypothetical protein